VRKSLYEILKSVGEISVAYKENAPLNYRYCMYGNNWKETIDGIDYSITMKLCAFGETLLDVVKNLYDIYILNKEKIKKAAERLHKFYLWKIKTDVTERKNYLEDYGSHGKLYRTCPVPGTESWYNSSWWEDRKDKYRIIKPGYIVEDYVVDEYGIVCYLIEHKPKIKGKKYYKYAKWNDENDTTRYNRRVFKKETRKEIEEC
jgi:hypothetical protein